MTKKITKKTEEKKQQQLDRVSSSKRLVEGLASSKQSRKISRAIPPSEKQKEPIKTNSVLTETQIKQEPEEEKASPTKVEVLKSELVKPLIKVETLQTNPAPKQACSAYIYFSAETQRKEKGTKTIIEIAKTAGEQWKEMSEEQKQPYSDLARKDVER
jgi:upstream-binding transcription factor